MEREDRGRLAFSEISNYDEFLSARELAGMTPGGVNGEGVFTLCGFFGSAVRWHTGDPDTDPWEWRMRVLSEGRGIAYGKFYYGKSGYLTRKWFPYLLAVRRGKSSFEELFAGDEAARRIYTLIRDNGRLSLHMLKLLGFFSREEKSDFERALTALQSSLFLTMCGQERKLSKEGREYGWNSTVFCLTEEFFGEESFHEAAALSSQNAFETLDRHLLRLNPEADASRRRRFLLGC